MLTLSAKLKTASIVAIAMASFAATPVLAEDITLWTLNFDNNAANTALKKVATDFEAANPGTHGSASASSGTSWRPTSSTVSNRSASSANGRGRASPARVTVTAISA